MDETQGLLRRLRGRSLRSRSILVIGLGRFGGSLARTLIDLGHEVLAVDSRSAIVAEYSTKLSHVVEANASDIEALRQLGAAEMPHAVVAIGSDIEASVLATAALSDLGVADIWAKALTEAHARILARVGAHHVVTPEVDMGRRVAHLVTGEALDYLDLDEGFALIETAAPREVLGRTLAEAGIRARYGVTVVCIKPLGQGFTYATPETIVSEGDLLLVAGETDRVDAFSELDR